MLISKLFLYNFQPTFKAARVFYNSVLYLYKGVKIQLNCDIEFEINYPDYLYKEWINKK